LLLVTSCLFQNIAWRIWLPGALGLAPPSPYQSDISHTNIEETLACSPSPAPV